MIRTLVIILGLHELNIMITINIYSFLFPFCIKYLSVTFSVQTRARDLSLFAKNTQCIWCLPLHGVPFLIAWVHCPVVSCNSILYFHNNCIETSFKEQTVIFGLVIIWSQININKTKRRFIKLRKQN